MIAAAGILFLAAPDDSVLLLRRTEAGDAPGSWSFPGGKLEDDETAAEAARREAIEEVGDHPNGELTLWTRRIKDGVDFTTFLQRVPQRFTPILSEEHDAFVWLQLTELQTAISGENVEA